MDSFLTGKLPRLKLEEQVVHDALWNERVDLEAELLTPLYSWQDELKAALQDHLTQLKLELELCRVELTCRFLDPLAEMLRLLN